MNTITTHANNLGIEVKEEKAGAQWENKSGQFQLIYPFNDDQYEGNNDSLVLYAKFGD
ncbi:hypothetical protein ACI2OX_09275 [Bacillus sp. N9]